MTYLTALPWSAKVLEEVSHERGRQRAKHGDQAHLPDGTGRHKRLLRSGWLPAFAFLADLAKKTTDEASYNLGDGTVTYADILLEEVLEAMAESDPVALRAELVQVAAVAVQWVETLDRRAAAEDAL